MSKILIVEDEPLILKSLEKLIRKRGFSVDVTSNGLEAIKLIKNNHYSKVICDLMLKDTTGFDVIEDVISTKGRPYIKDHFIIMTAYISDKVISKASNYGCTVLSKPFKDLTLAITEMTQGVSDEITTETNC